MSLLAELAVKVRIDMENFAGQLSQARQSLEGFGKEMSATGRDLTKNLSAPIVGVSVSMLALAKHTGETADSIMDLAATTGMSTDAIQEWQHVARMTGVTLNAVTDNIERFINRLPQIEAEGGRAFQVMEELGVAIRDVGGEMRDADVIVEEIIAALQDLDNEMERNAKASQLFGRSWMDIAPILNQGSGELEAMREQARALGLVMDSDALAAADEFRRSFVELQAVVHALTLRLGSALLPVLKDSLIPAFENMLPSIEKIITVLGNLADMFNRLPGPIQSLIVIMAGLLTVMGPMMMVIGQISLGFAALTTAGVKLTASLAALKGIGLAVGVAMKTVLAVAALLAKPFLIAAAAVLALVAAFKALSAVGAAVKGAFSNFGVGGGGGGAFSGGGGGLGSYIQGTSSTGGGAFSGGPLSGGSGGITQNIQINSPVARSLDEEKQDYMKASRHLMAEWSGA